MRRWGEGGGSDCPPRPGVWWIWSAGLVMETGGDENGVVSVRVGAVDLWQDMRTGRTG